MQGMDMDELRRTMIEKSEIEFAYQGREGVFQKYATKNDPDSVEISIWLSEPAECIFSEVVTTDEERVTACVDRLLTANIFDGGKSFVTGEADINIICIFG